MDKRRIDFLIGLFLCVLLLAKPMYTQAMTDFEIEQVQIELPETAVYLRCEEQPKAEELEIWLEEKKLTVSEIERFAEAEQGIDYFILVDVSNSMPDEYCTSVKEALLSFAEGLNSHDKLILIAFGEEVAVLLEGTEDADTKKAAIESIHNTDRKTLLFEAMLQTADMADKLQDDARKIVLVISDGENFAAGASTSEEAKTALSQRNIPVYAMGISDTDKENLNKFGETARTLGGTLTVFTAEETQTALGELNAQWAETWVLRCQSENNRVNHRMNTLTVKAPESGISRSKSVMVSKYLADDIKPQILSVEKVGERQVEIVFSEKVLGAELGTAWSVSYDSENLPVITATYADQTGERITLEFEKTLYAGTYLFAAPGISDDSMEENAVENTVSVELEGEEPIEEEVPAWKLWLREWWWSILAAVFMIVLLAVLLIWHKIKKNKGIVYVDGKATLLKNVEERQRITILHEEGLSITFELVGTVGQEQKRIDTVINGSLIVGRASICDLSLEDARLSRQHFALEHREGNVFITDLQTTNGTTVNGVVIHRKHKLNSGDIIAAGNLQLRIRW